MVAQARLPTARSDELHPAVDGIVVLRGLTWADYQRMLEIRGDHSSPRFTFLEGELEIMSPSKPHESIKSKIGCLVDVYCMEQGINFDKLGSWTLEQKELNRGIEPDESYYFGADPDPALPDLAIEVIWTSGAINKPDVYRKLGVREVWFWQRGTISTYVLAGDNYEPRTTSTVLPNIDLALLESFLHRPTAGIAIRDYRDALKK